LNLYRGGIEVFNTTNMKDEIKLSSKWTKEPSGVRHISEVLEYLYPGLAKSREEYNNKKVNIKAKWE